MKRCDTPVEASSTSNSPSKDLTFLSDVPLLITAEAGRCEITIRKLLGLTTGSILTLNEDESVTVTLRANGQVIGKGEVVTVNEKMGVRVTDVNDPTEREY